jgi:gluconate 2-dehydrogenase gamma chain
MKKLMTEKIKFNRRGFVQIALTVTGGFCLLPGCIRSASQWRFFTDDEAKLIDAFADQIIPPDEWPGGREAGVTNFIDKQLVGPYIRFQVKYRKGVEAVRKTCEIRYRKTFEDLDWDEQTAFLESMQAGKLKEPVWEGSFDKEFFSMIRDHSMQAYYGSPVHGGNKNKMSYKMLKLDYPLIIGQNRYNIR